MSLLRCKSLGSIRTIVLTLVLLFGLSIGRAWALSFNHIQESDGLRSRRCYSIVQDGRGFIWIANKFGIDRFDGKKITSYNLGRSPNESNIRINMVCLSPNGTLWAYDLNGHIYRYSDMSDSFEQMLHIRQKPQMNSRSLSGVSFEDDENIFINTDNGVYIFNVLTREVDKINGLPQVKVHEVLKHDGCYYIASNKGVIRARIEGVNATVTDIFMKEIMAINLCSNGNILWIGSFGDGIYALPLKEGGVPQRIANIPNVPIRQITSYDSSKIIVSSDGAGCFFIDTKSQQVEQIIPKTDPNYSHSVNARGVFVDNQRNIWIASYHQGVMYSDNLKFDFKIFSHKENNPNSLSDNFVNTAIEDTVGNLWFGTNDGVSFLDRKSGRWRHFFQNENDVRNVVIRTLCQQGDYIWAGGFSFGVARIDIATGEVVRHKKDDLKPIIADNNINVIFKRSSDVILFSGSGLAEHNVRTGTTRFLEDRVNNAFGVVFDDKILMGRNSGLYMFDDRTETRKPTALTKAVHSMAPAANGSFWISSEGTLYNYEILTNRLIEISERQGLVTPFIHSIVEDRRGDVWLGCEDGLRRYEPGSGRISKYDMRNGLPTNLFNRGAWMTNSGEILFSSAEGAVIFNPDSIPKQIPAYNMPLTFTCFSLFNEPVNPSDANSALSRPVGESSVIRLKHNQNFFTLSFTAPNFQTPQKMLYSYKLSPFDNDWSKPQPDGTATYSKLVPGRYTFNVRLMSDDRFVEQRTMTILISRAWWDSAFAWIIYTLLLLGIVVYAVTLYRQRQDKRLTRLKLDFFESTAHDILTPLNLIEAPLKDIQRDAILSDEHKGLMQLALSNTEKLNLFISNLLDFQRVSNNFYRLSVEQHDMIAYMQNIVVNHRVKMKQKNIDLQLEVPDNDGALMLWFDIDKIERIVDNLMSNAFKYTGVGGSVKLTLRVDQSRWHLTVSDNGIGIPKDIQPIIFSHIVRATNAIRSNQPGSGLGLKMTSALVKLHKGDISFRSEQGKGSEFYLSFPLSYDNATHSKSRREIKRTLVNDASEHTPINIVIVEDDVELASYLFTALSRHFHVRHFLNGKTALEEISKSLPDIIISDIDMPQMDGFEFCRCLKERRETAAIPLIFITGMASQHDVVKGLEMGAADYIVKPVDPQVVEIKIRNLFRERHKAQQQYIEEIKGETAFKLGSEQEQEFISRVMQIIEQNISKQDFTIDIFCKELAMSRTLIYQKITLLTGLAPVELVREVRLKRAAQLLLSGKHTVAEVSYLVGMDSKYFSRKFKEYFGVSPKDFISK